MIWIGRIINFGDQNDECMIYIFKNNLTKKKAFIALYTHVFASDLTYFHLELLLIRSESTPLVISSTPKGY